MIRIEMIGMQTAEKSLISIPDPDRYLGEQRFDQVTRVSLKFEKSSGDRRQVECGDGTHM